MQTATILSLIYLTFLIVFWAAAIYLYILLCKALKRYIKSADRQNNL